MPGKLVADITAFDVTYANVLAPVGFHKAMTANDECISADITNGIEGAQVTNLWYAQQDDEEDPIVNVDVIYDEEETPFGFTKLDKDLVGGLEEEKSYIIYQRMSQFKMVMGDGNNIEELLPLCSLKIAFSKDFNPVFIPEYEKVHKNILRTKGEAFVFFRRRRITDKTRWHPRHLKLKDLCDAYDEFGSWCFAQIIEMNNPHYPGMVKVHYTRWLGPRYDEWIPLNKKRFAPYNTKPKKKTEIKIGRPWKLNVDDVMPLLKNLITIQNNPDAIDKECEVSLILMVDRFLRKKLVSPIDDDEDGNDKDSDDAYDSENSTQALKNIVYHFFRKIVQIGAWMLKDRERIRAKFIAILRKVLFANEDFTYFFDHEGYHKQSLFGGDANIFVVPEPLDFREFAGINENLEMQHDGIKNMDVNCDEGSKEINVSRERVERENKVFIETNGSRRMKGHSLYYGSLFNYFGEIGGLNSILSILDEGKDDPDRVSLKIVEDLVAIVCAPKKLYLDNVKNSFIVDFRNKLEGRLAELSKKELQKLDYECLNEILNRSEQLFLQVDDTFSGDQRRELYNLNLIKRILSCSILNKRIEAIDDLSTYIKLTEEREGKKRNPVGYSSSYSSSSSGYGNKYSNGYNRNYMDGNHNGDNQIKVKWLTPKTLSNWIFEQGILKLILQGSPENTIAPHVAIATKALVGGGGNGDFKISLLQFLAKQDKISLEDIDSLWNMAMDTNETTAMKDIIFKSLELVIPFLKKDLYQHIAGKIHDITMEQLNESTVKLVSGLCVAPSPRRKTRKSLLSINFNPFSSGDNSQKVGEKPLPKAVGARLLWMAVQDEAEIANDLKDVLCKEIKKILSSNIFHYDEILEDMIKNIDENKSMKRTMFLLQELFEVVDVVDLEKVNEFLFNQHALKDKVIRSLLSCKNVQQLTYRLNFLAFLFDGQGKMNTKELLSLWDTLISMQPEYRSIFFSWLREKKCYTDEGEKALYNQRLCYFFTKKVWESDMYAAFKCFKSFFLSVNSKNNSLLQKVTCRSSNDDIVKSIIDIKKVDGIETFWHILSHVSSNDDFGTDEIGTTKILEKCVKLYIHVLMRVEVVEEKKQVWSQFVVNCMDKLDEFSTSSPKSCRGIVLALRAFVSSTKNIRMEINPTGSPHQLLYARVMVTWSGGARYGGVIDNFNPQRGMHHVLYDDGQKRWYEVDEDDYGNLQGYNEKGAHLFEIVRLDDAVLNDPEIISMRRLPEQIIGSNKKYFNSLFKLLAISSIESDIWSLLTENLPINNELLMSIRDCGKIKSQSENEYWKEQLGNIKDAPLCFLYSLRIIGDFSLPVPGSSGTEIRTCERFCESFICSGGFAYLYILILDSQHAISKFSISSLSSECLNLILRILNQCFHIIISNPTIQASLEIDVTQIRMCSKILELIVDANKNNDVESPNYDNNRNKNINTGNNDKKIVVVDLQAPGENNEWSQDGTLKVANAISVADEQHNRKLSSLILSYDELISPMLLKRPGYFPLRIGNSVSTLIDAFALIKSIISLSGGSPSMLIAFLCEPLLLETCSEYLLKSKQKEVREAFAFSLFQLIKSERDGNFAMVKLFELLISLIDDVASMRVDRGLEYFHFLISILRGNTILEGIDVLGIAEKCALIIASFNSTINNSNAPTNTGGEMFLQGILALMVVLLQRKETSSISFKEKLGLSKLKGGLNLCNRAYDHCLSTDAKKLMHGSNITETRRLCFALLSSLADNCTSNAECIAALLKDRHQFKDEAMDEVAKVESDSIVCNDPGGAYSNRYDRNGPRAPCGFVGLKNLGCVCYMNSTLQNLFMCDVFRRQIFNIDIKKIPNQHDMMDSVIYQVQKMFSYLQESQKRYFNPGGFCYAFKDPERPGLPTPVREQRDASGFFLGLLNSIKDACVTTEYNEQVLSNFQVESLLELSATAGDGTKLKKLNKKAKEPMLSVRVRDLSGLEESLDNYFAGEQVDGYKWERDNGEEENLSTMKRDTIKKLPETLVFHLQRFETDYMMDPPQTKKINTRFVIPHTLDMTKYTLEGRTKDEDNKPLPHPAEYYQYELHGITIHTGTANGGHYFSYARERGSDPSNWMCFNDEKVRSWSIENLERDCFGGESERNGRKYQNMANAFMVFYERKKKKLPTVAKNSSSVSGDDNCNHTLDDGEESKSGSNLGAGLMAIAAVGKMLNNTEEFRNRFKTRGLIPSYIYGEIYKENIAEMYEEQTGNSEYFDFIESLLALEFENGGSARIEICKLCVSFVLTTILKSKDVSLLGTWIEKLKRIVVVETSIAEWLLDLIMNNSVVLGTILQQNESKIMSLCTQFIAYCLNVVYDGSSGDIVNAYVKYSIEGLLSEDAGGSKITTDSKCKFSIFTQFFASSTSYTPSTDILKTIVALVKKERSEINDELVQILSKSIENVDGGKNVEDVGENSNFEIITSDVIILFAIENLENVNTKSSAEDILYNITRCNSKCFVQVLEIIKKWAGTDATSYKCIPLLYGIYRILLKILDKRLLRGDNVKEHLLVTMLNVINENKNYWIFTVKGVFEMLQLAARRKDILSWLHANTVRFEWLELWFTDNNGRHESNRMSCEYLYKNESAYDHRRDIYSDADEIDSNNILNMMQQVLRGKPPPIVGYFPEDKLNPESMIGRHVKIRWSSRSSYTGYVS